MKFEFKLRGWGHGSLKKKPNKQTKLHPPEELKKKNAAEGSKTKTKKKKIDPPQHPVGIR